MDRELGVLLTVTRKGNEVVIAARGQLDFSNKPMLVETVKSAARQSVSCYALDLELVSFIDSESLKAILFLQDSFAKLGKTLRVGKCSTQVARTLCLLGIADILGMQQPAGICPRPA